MVTCPVCRGRQPPGPRAGKRTRLLPLFPQLRLVKQQVLVQGSVQTRLGQNDHGGTRTDGRVGEVQSAGPGKPADGEHQQAPAVRHRRILLWGGAGRFRHLHPGTADGR